MIETSKSSAEKESASGRSGWVIPFFALWTSQAFSLLASQLASFVLIWYLTQTTGSAAVLTFAMLLNLLPQIFLGPFAGALIDRWSRKTILIATDLLIVVATLGLAALFAFGGVSISSIYLWIFILGLANGFINPTMLATTSLMVPDQHLTRLQGMNQTLQGGLGIIYAPLGALLYEALPMQSILAMNTLPVLVAVICLFFIAIPQPNQSGLAVRNIARELQEGLRYIFTWPGLRLVIGIAVLLNFLDTPAMTLLPLLVANYFKGSALQLGWMNSIFGLGVILGGLVLSLWGGFRRRMATSMSGIIGMGVGAILMGIAPVTVFSLAVVGIFIKGMMQSIANAPIIATLQSAVEPDMQGRVMSLVIALTSAAAPVGLLIGGLLGERLSIQILFILVGIGCFLLGSAGFLIPSLIRLGENTQTIPKDLN